MNFVQVLVFSFGLVGVWCIKEFCTGPWSQPAPKGYWRPLGTGLVFILIAFVLSIGFIKIG